MRLMRLSFQLVFRQKYSSSFCIYGCVNVNRMIKNYVKSVIRTLCKRLWVHLCFCCQWNAEMGSGVSSIVNVSKISTPNDWIYKICANERWCYSQLQLDVHNVCLMLFAQSFWITCTIFRDIKSNKYRIKSYSA